MFCFQPVLVAFFEFTCVCAPQLLISVSQRRKHTSNLYWMRLRLALLVGRVAERPSGRAAKRPSSRATNRCTTGQQSERP